MKDIGIFTLLTVIVSAAAPASPDRSSPPAAQEYGPAKTFVTAKSADQFASCFASTQDSDALPWSYVPKDNGGTFSNLGPRTLASAYFVVISDRGPRREVRLEGGGRDEIAVNKAVNQCV